MILQQTKDYEMASPFAFSMTVTDVDDPTDHCDRDHFYAPGSFWLNQETGVLWICRDAKVGHAYWDRKSLSAGFVRLLPLAHIPATTDRLIVLQDGQLRQMSLQGLFFNEDTTP